MPRPLRSGQMSLLEMINCSGLSSICSACSQLMLEQIVREDVSAWSFTKNGRDLDAQITPEAKASVLGWFKVIGKIADDFEWKAVHDRIKVTKTYMEKHGITNRRLATELRVLRETISLGLENQLIYRYPNEKGDLFKKWTHEWALVIEAFPSARFDIGSAGDLRAIGHSTASVFHLMRVLEHGIRALAADVGKSFDVQNWQNIIDEIESEIRSQGKSLPRGLSKSERLKFLSEAAKEFVYFKDGWRNYVSHNRSVYDEYQARSALEHVRSFMIVLSSCLREKSEER